MIGRNRDFSYRKIVFYAVVISLALHFVLFLALSEFELDLFSIVQDKELSVTMVDPKAPSLPPSTPATPKVRNDQPENHPMQPPAEKPVETAPPISVSNPAADNVSASVLEGAPKSDSSTLPETEIKSQASHEILPVKREVLKYDLYWSGVYVGKAELEAFRGDRSVTFLSKARSAGIISAFYTVDDFAQSILFDGRPVFFRFKQHEGKKRGIKETKFNYETHQIIFTHETRNIKSQHDMNGEGVWDILSAFYFVRTQPLDIGKKLGVNVFDSGTFARIGVDVLRKESITVPKMGTFNTVIIRPQVETEGLFSKKGDIYIWLSDDDARIPLRVETVVPIGAVTAELRNRLVEN
jgi:hypothetical protein